MRHECLARRTTIVANRPGLATLKCLDCGARWLVNYQGKKPDAIREKLREARRGHVAQQVAGKA